MAEIQDPYMRKLILTILIFYSIAAQAQNRKDTILVVGMDTSQFYSNVFFKDEVAHYNNVGRDTLIDFYNTYLIEVLKRVNDDEFVFVPADSMDQELVQKRSNYLEVEKDDGSTFIGIAAGAQNPDLLKDLMELYNVDYLLTLNAYEIYRKNPPSFTSYATKTRHFVHFDLFDSTLTTIMSGKFGWPSYAVEAFYNVEQYFEFGQDVLRRVKASRLDEAGMTMEEKYNYVLQSVTKNAFGIGFQTGLGTPYGLLGIYLSQYFGNNLEITAGIGYDFSGFKYGAGGRYYFLRFDQSFKPFFALHFTRASGNSFWLGNTTDDSGFVNNSEASRFRIPADNNIHVKGGLRFLLGGNNALLVSAGYGFSFNQFDAEFLEGVRDEGRQDFADFMSVGGLDISLGYVIYLRD